jgi:two-component system, OmpR family, response regulator
MARILVIEDEADIRQVLDYNLKSAGHEVVEASRGVDGLRLLREREPDLVLLDLMLPDMPGTEVCRSIKDNPATRALPVVMLTARGEEIDRVVGFEIGADDYITKPFSLEEVIARLRAILRRTGTGAQKPCAARLIFADIALDEATREVSRAGVPVSLSPTEFRLLRYLVINAGTVLSKQRIFDHMWCHNVDGNANCVESYISHLRHKIDTDDDKRLLRTLRGVGYVLREPRPQDHQRSSCAGAAREA